MGGKVSLMLVMLFSALFALFGTNILKSSVAMTDNFSNYYNNIKAQSIAISGANMAINQLFLNKNWMTGYSSIDYASGELNVDIDTVGWDERKITSIGTFNGINKKVEILLEPENFALFGNFYNVLGSVWWATGDTLQGRFHTNDFINCYYNPVFLGPATSVKGVKLYNASSHPEFHGGTELVNNIPIQFDTSAIRVAAYTNGKIFRDTTNSGKTVFVDLTFLASGQVKYRIKLGSTGTYGSYSTVALTSLSPNGVIYVEKGNINVEGTLNGRATLVATEKGASDAGRINITNSIQYKDNPLTDPSCDDMMGMVAENSVHVTKNTTRGDITIHSAIFSQKDGLVIDNYSDYPTAYKMNLVGGIIGEKLQATADYDGSGNPIRGYSYIHRYDTRFEKIRPPYFPSTNHYRIVTWYEE